MQDADPFLLLDQLGPVVNEPGAAKGAPWHPHRGFETVTYLLSGEVQHTDSHGGGGVITAGATQWMTAGSGLLHDEVPTEKVLREGGAAHGVQLWVNLPASKKWIDPRYQAIEADEVVVARSSDGGTVAKVIAGDLAGVHGPGSTQTPITYAHLTVAPGAQVSLPTDELRTLMLYALTGHGAVVTAADELAPLPAHSLAVFARGLGAGSTVVVRADGDEPLDVLFLSGRPLQEPIAHYGPFVMNTRAEIQQAIEDFQKGRMGSIPAVAS
jgi:redox-sensitive bicupin YhaK (pirin superfamily)